MTGLPAASRHVHAGSSKSLEMPGEAGGRRSRGEASCGFGLGGASNRHRTGTDRLAAVVVTRQNIRHGVHDQIHPSSPPPHPATVRILLGNPPLFVPGRRALFYLSAPPPRASRRRLLDRGRAMVYMWQRLAWATNLARCEGVSGLAVRLYTPLYFTVRNSGVWPPSRAA